MCVCVCVCVRACVRACVCVWTVLAMLPVTAARKHTGKRQRSTANASRAISGDTPPRSKAAPSPVDSPAAKRPKVETVGQTGEVRGDTVGHGVEEGGSEGVEEDKMDISEQKEGEREGEGRKEEEGEKEQQEEEGGGVLDDKSEAKSGKTEEKSSQEKKAVHPFFGACVCVCVCMCVCVCVCACVSVIVFPVCDSCTNP